jgi:N-acetylglutamate synthase-like GNAT family acetyltransferase
VPPNRRSRAPVNLKDTGAVISVRRATDADVEGCVRILTLLPEYSTADAHDELRTAMPAHRDGVAIDNAEDIVGFELAEQRDERWAEITFAAVRPDRRRVGMGTP